MPEINLSKGLAAKAEKVEFILLSKGIKNPPIMRVVAALDISGSMAEEYATRGGKACMVQAALDQLLGISIKFDDNGEIDMWKFDDRSDYVGVCTPDDFGDYIAKNNIGVRGGTAYSPLINDIVDRMFVSGARETKTTGGGFFGFGKKTVEQVTPPSNVPVLALIITDGEPAGDRRSAIDKALQAAASHPIYFQFVGVTDRPETLTTIVDLADKYDDVGSIILSGFHLSDDEVYRQLFSDELINWVSKFNSPQAAIA
jgi:hypothetical protein